MTTDLQKSVEDAIEALKELKDEEATRIANIEVHKKQQKEFREATEATERANARVTGELEVLKRERDKIQKEIESEREHSNTIFLKREKEFTELWEKRNEQLRVKENEINVKLQEALLKIEKEKAKYKTKQNIVVESTEEAIKIQVREIQAKEELLNKRESLLIYKMRIHNKKVDELKRQVFQHEDRVKTFRLNAPR